MSRQITGQFDVQRTPQPGCDLGDGAEASHLRLEKQFHGPLEARSVVHMLAVSTPVSGSAAYVAVERVSGSVDGRRGSFLFQHNGTMDRGAPTLSLTVVPDSADGELQGLRGQMAIDIVDGQHHYRFDYTLTNGSLPK